MRKGMVATATRTILENLDRLPNEDQRTKVAIIAYDTSIYFFSMSVSFVLYLALLGFLEVCSLSRQIAQCSLCLMLTMCSCLNPMTCL